MLTDRKGRRVSELSGPGMGGPWPRARPPLDGTCERVEPGWAESGHTRNATAMTLDPQWRNARLDATLTFCGAYWTCTRGCKRACGDTAKEAMVECLYG